MTMLPLTAEVRVTLVVPTGGLTRYQTSLRELALSSWKVARVRAMPPYWMPVTSAVVSQPMVTSRTRLAQGLVEWVQESVGSQAPVAVLEAALSKESAAWAREAP